MSLSNRTICCESYLMSFMEEDQGGQNKSQRSRTGIHQNVLTWTKVSGTNETKLEVFSQSIWLWKGTTIFISLQTLRICLSQKIKGSLVCQVFDQFSYNWKYCSVTSNTYFGCVVLMSSYQPNSDSSASRLDVFTDEITDESGEQPQSFLLFTMKN